MNLMMPNSDNDERRPAARAVKKAVPWILVPGLLVITYLEVRHYPVFQHNQPAVVQQLPNGQAIEAPRGSQRQFTLPDGTKGWLNAASSLEYSPVMAKGERIVSLIGEAFFDVAQQPGRPFRVHTGDVVVEEIGTLFNVRNYPEERVCRTVVAEGSVKVIDGDNQVVLHAEDEVDIEPASTAETSLKIIRGVNTGAATSWINGFVTFHNDDINTVLHNLARAYDVDVQIVGEIPGNKFSGSYPTNEPLEDIIRQLDFHDFHVSLLREDAHHLTIKLSP
jgi:ferric-dicitrate binding protein FerR (iron transport regulator)